MYLQPAQTFFTFARIRDAVELTAADYNAFRLGENISSVAKSKPLKTNRVDTDAIGNTVSRLSDEGIFPPMFSIRKCFKYMASAILGEPNS